MFQYLKNLKRLMIFTFVFVILVNMVHTVKAADTTESNAANIDLLWMLICAILVFMMQAGFMCLESG
ncbi:MAG TPA: ammonium transporter, partial [Candidatus Poseidoniia archaeon]|nr:ammonium transporter [Candidatus Poseidoniia archaeon]